MVRCWFCHRVGACSFRQVTKRQTELQRSTSSRSVCLPHCNRYMKKIQKLINTTKDKGLDAVFISNPKNIYYLSGYGCSNFAQVQTISDPEAFLLITKDKTYILADSRTAEKAKKIKGFDYLALPSPCTPESLVKIIEGVGPFKSIGFEESSFIYSEFMQIKKYLKTTDISEILIKQRLIKSTQELMLLKQAAKITGDGFEYALSILKKGMTEKDLACEIKSYFEKNADGCSFPSVVAFGKGSAIPHYESSNKVVIKNDGILLIDLGCIYKGYCGDMTRTVYTGKAPKLFEQRYESVLSAQRNCLNNLKVGLTGKQADNLARKKFTENQQNMFVHGTGHGIGLDIHETPKLNKTSNQILKNGMVFSVEPGLYYSGWGGIRIEDVVFMWNGKPVNITPTSKKLRGLTLM